MKKILDDHSIREISSILDDRKENGFPFEVADQTKVQFGEYELAFTCKHDALGIIDIHDTWFEKDSVRYLVPSVIFRDINAFIMRLGKPQQKIDLDFTPLELLFKYGKEINQKA